MIENYKYQYQYQAMKPLREGSKKKKSIMINYDPPSEDPLSLYNLGRKHPLSRQNSLEDPKRQKNTVEMDQDSGSGPETEVDSPSN